ncbi:MAG: tRNA pseudouridine(55) synthase TruB [Bowdeniella nasicola]|nr:tRNA pseudouridine(55) synthase TruB [Bowdeniella nasicola]
MTDASSGLVLINKESGPTSHSVVGQLRRTLGTRKIGHAGTLDPMATGLLIAGVGKATRLLTYLVGLDKRYRATIRLGESRTTDDASGELVTATDAFRITDAEITAAFGEFRGEIMQRPTAVSAIKVDGQRAYDRVRAGEEVDLPARPVTISSLDILGPLRPTTGAGGDGVVDIDVDLRVSSGTYVRAIARDLGEKLGVGGHLTQLERTEVGPFTLAEASTVSEPQLLDPLAVMGRVMPVRELSEAEAKDLSYGRFIPLSSEAAPFEVAAYGGDIVAVTAPQEGRARPVLVLQAGL